MSETCDQHEYVTQFAVFVLQHPLLVQRDFYHQKKKIILPFQSYFIIYTILFYNALNILTFILPYYTLK